jgi:hypothetical protein
MQFTHQQLEESTPWVSTGIDLPSQDLGPYELIGGDGIPEGGNFRGSIKFGDGKILVMESWGYTKDPDNRITPEEMDEIYNRLIDLTGHANLVDSGKTEEEADEAMSKFWSLDGWMMENNVMKEMANELD